MTADIQAEVLEDAAPLESAWWNLWARDPSATPFQSPAWLLPWRRHFRDGDSLVLALRREGRLMGVLPLFAWEGRLLPWGAGNTDYLGGVFDPELDPKALAVAFGCRLCAPLDLFQIPPGSMLLAMPAPDGWEDRRFCGDPCPELALPAELPANMAQNLRYYRRRAERAGALTIGRAGPDLLECLAELHAARWRDQGAAGVLNDARVLGFHRDALPGLDRAGLLRLYALALDGRTVAALYALTGKGRTCYYLSGFDPRFGRLGLGTIIVGHAIAEAQREGACAFDFLRGREAYKYRWGATDRPTHARRLIPPGR